MEGVPDNVIKIKEQLVEELSDTHSVLIFFVRCVNNSDLAMHHDRGVYLRDLSQLATTYRNRLNEIMTKIGWNYQSLNHEHTGMIMEELDTPGEDVPADSSIKDESSSELCSGFPGSNEQGTSSEKLYNELLAGLQSSSATTRVKKKTEEERLAEILEKERNAKRRRVSYKNKIHTKNKSTTEVLRELVKQQMEFLVESALDAKPSHSSEPHERTQPGDANPKDQELILVSFSGNPHLAWQKVAILPELNHRKSSESRERNEGSDREREQKRRRRSRSSEKDRTVGRFEKDKSRPHRRYADDDDKNRRSRYGRESDDSGHRPHRRDHSSKSERTRDSSESKHRSRGHKHKRDRFPRDNNDRESEESNCFERKDKEKKHRHSHKKGKKHSRNRDQD